MVELVANCPRCGARHITFDISAVNLVGVWYGGWQHRYEAFGICRHCKKGTIFKIEENAQHHDIELFKRKSPLDISGALNGYFDVVAFISLKDQTTIPCPEHVDDEEVARVFQEGATCLTVECWNAAGTMFRACIDLATRPLLPTEDTPGLNNRTRRDLGLRLPWLFDTGRLPNNLREISNCIREDGNDGAHHGTLTKVDAEDLLDFTVALLQRLYTEPRRLEMANERRLARRSKPEG